MDQTRGMYDMYVLVIFFSKLNKTELQIFMLCHGV